VQEAVRLGCSAIGFTIYPGSDNAFEMMGQIREMAEEAKAYGAKWDDVERTWYTTGENYAQHKDFFDGYNPTASQENTNACPW